MLSKKLFFWITLAFFCAVSAGAEEFPRPDRIKLAHENRNAFPWVYQPEPSGVFIGLDIDIIRMAASRLDVPVSFEAHPWMRALEEMRQGLVDGAFASSHVQDRERHGVYPRRPDGTLDVDRRLHLSGYALYVLAGTEGHFDGCSMDGAPERLGVQAHFSIARILRDEFGCDPIEVAHADPDVLLRMVLLGRLGATALQVDRADYLIRNDDEFSDKIVKFDPDREPFKLKPYFLMFSHQFHETYPEFAERFWDACREIRMEMGVDEPPLPYPIRGAED